MKKEVNKLVKLMIAKGLTLALAESVTCGLAAHQLNIVTGTSEMFMGSIVCYNEAVKQELFGISENVLKKYSAESQEITDLLAKNLHKLIRADVYAAITGLATDGASESKDKPVGTIFFSICRSNNLISRKKKFNGSPLDIKKKACLELYKILTEVISKQ